MRIQHCLSLRRLLFVVLGTLIICSQGFGGTLTWQQTDQGERLVFKFDSRLPDTKPKFHQPNKLIFHLNWAFWQRERKFKLPVLPSSALFQDIAYTPQQGIILTMNSKEFDFTFSTKPKSKEFVLDIWSLVPKNDSKQPQTDATGNASEISPDFQNTTSEDQISSQTQGKIQIKETLLTGPGNQTPGLDNGTIPHTNSTAHQGDMPAAPEEDFEAEPRKESESKPIRKSAFQSTLEPEEFLSGMTQIRGKVLWSQENLASEEPLSHIGSEQDTQSEHKQSQPAVVPEEMLTTSTDLHNHSQNQNTLNNVTQDTGQSPSPHIQHPLDMPNATNLDDHTQNTFGQGDDTFPRHMLNATSSVTTDNSTMHMNATEHMDVDALHTTNATSVAALKTLYNSLTKALEDQDLDAIKNTAQAMLKSTSLSPDLREDLLYTLADLAWNKGQDDMQTHFTATLLALEAAKNSNLQSERLPQILEKLGRLHLLVENLPEAKAYFDLLRRRYPHDEHVPMIDIFWGEYYLGHGHYTKAHEHFQYILQNYGDEQIQKRAHSGLAKTLAGLGFLKQAEEIVERIQARWPDFRLDDPSFLMNAGYVAMMNEQLDQANQYLWTYVNLVPQADDADIAWARIGDIYAQKGQRDTARKTYRYTISTYPEKEGSLIAQMRVAEEGILDPTAIPVIEKMNMTPAAVYERIAAKKHSALAPIARLKLAMLYLWQKEYALCLEETELFEKEFPKHDLLTNAQEVAQTALQEWINQKFHDKNYAALLDLWNQYAAIFNETGPTAQLSLILATAYAQENMPLEALDMARPLVFGPLPKGKYSEPALDLMLSIFLELENWEEIPKLAQQVATWNLPQEQQQNINYATALALENLRDHDAASALWLKLATDQDGHETQRGYAHFFLAQSASTAGDFTQANVLAQEALYFLLKDKTDITKIRDTLELLIELAEKTEQPKDALAWSLQYDDYLEKTDSFWPAHTWRKALLYKKNDNLPQWQDNLQELIQLYPNSLHGRMATSELENARLTKEAQKFH